MGRPPRDEYDFTPPEEGPVAQTIRAEVKRRIERGWSINEIADEAGVSQPILQRWMTGVRNDMRLSTADRLAVYFGFRLAK